MIKNVFKHLKRVCIHKYWVAYYCFKCGLYWQGLVHDLSKFSWIEFSESVKYYDDKISPIIKAKEVNGYSMAWLHHKGRNPHHYEYWTTEYDNGTVALEMPYKYVVELICDWLGAARVYMGGDFSYNKEYTWWITKLTTMPPKMHPNTSEFISQVFLMLAVAEDELENPGVILDEQRLKHIYELYCSEVQQSELLRQF